VSLKFNILAGMASSAWSALLGILVVPLFLRYISVEAYGLVGVYVTITTMLIVFDLGLVATLNREVARASSVGSIDKVGPLLHSLAVIYWTIGLFLGLGIFLLSPWLATQWLNPAGLSRDTVERALRLMALVIAVRWPLGLYQAAMIGAQRIIPLSMVNIVMTTVANLGAVGIMAFWTPRIEAYFIWQAAVALSWTLALRLGAWRYISRTAKAGFSWPAVRTVARFSLGMTGVSLLGVVLSQMDRALLSRLLALDEFGIYVIAATVSGTLYVVTTPVFNGLNPRLTALVRQADTVRVEATYRTTSRGLASFIFPVAMLLIVYAQDFLLLWTGKPDLAGRAAPLVSLLTAGTALHCCTFMPYALQLAYGAIRLTLNILVILVVCAFPVMLVLTQKYGAIGAAYAWLLLHSCYIVIGSLVTHRSLMRSALVNWLWSDIGIPLMIAVAFGLLGRMDARNSDGTWRHLFAGGGLTVAAALLSIATSPRLRETLYRSLKPKTVPC
jgi:O-antigen/teichoic acid export membrane protein